MQRISASKTEKITALRRCRYFSNIGDEILMPLASATQLHSFSADEMIFLEDDLSEGLYIIRRGSVKLSKISPQGRELVLNVLETGESFNEVPVFDQGGNPVTVSALEESELWIVNAAAIRAALSEHPQLAQTIILNLAQNLRMLVSMVEELSFYQVTTRLARLLSSLSPEQLTGHPGQRLTQDDLAVRVGTVREVVARSLRKLELSGAISVSRNKIVILEAEKLMEWAHAPDGDVQ